jgi:hypothetical protein
MKMTNLTWSLLPLIATIASLSYVGRASAATITQWNFESPSNIVAVNNSPAPSSGTGTASSIGMDVYPTPNVGVTTDDVLLGKSADTGANAVANLTQIWRVRAQAGVNGAANGWSSAAPIGTQGAVFATSTVGYSSINVSFDWYSTTQGEANLQLEYTTNGTTWNNLPISLSGSDAGLVAATNSSSPNTVLGSYVSDNLLSNGTPAGQGWFTGLTATLPAAAANNPNFAIEMVNASTGADDVSTQGTALNNSSGNWRFDNVTISGTVAVPEPTSLILAGLGLMGMVLMHGRRRAAL